ncbi:hypothetical protein GOP47_0029717 [Adiantum capillus-veneris]|nr:hypothetical protein GOP47_0029717 [Adiantum capillus-veneris]
MLDAMSNLLLQVNQTNQSLLHYITAHNSQSQKTDHKIRPKPFSGLPTEDALTWLDHFDNIASYHQWSDERRALETRTLFEGVAATWFVQQPEAVKHDWHVLKALLVHNFAHQNITQTALQQPNTLRQQQHKPVAQFAVKLNQLLLCANATMSEEMKLFFLWPHLRHDLSRRVPDQGPTSFHLAIQISQRIEGASQTESAPSQTFASPSPPQLPPQLSTDQVPTPMATDVQHA